MANTFVYYLHDLEVRVVPNRGNTSLTFLNENIKRLKQKQREGKAVHILSYGDLDPSGDYMMSKDIPDRMKKLGFDPEINGGSYEIVAVTKDQIQKYNLPWDPDPPTRAKIQKGFKIEILFEKIRPLVCRRTRRLPAIIPDVFRDDLIIGKVEQYSDKEIYDNLREKYSKNDIRKILRDRIRDLKI